jgi:hypothetical protein
MWPPCDMAESKVIFYLCPGTSWYSISVQALLNISRVTDATASTILQCRLGRLLTLAEYTFLTYSHRKKSRDGMKPPQPIHIPVNCSMRNSVTGVQKRDGAPSCYINQVPVAQHSSLVCPGTQHLSLLFHAKKNGLFTVVLVSMNQAFNFGLYYSCSLTSWGFWDLQMQQSWQLTLAK